ncbi:MAG: HEAT repeat domain-containing protein, partial [Myxococcota bacterium]
GQSAAGLVLPYLESQDRNQRFVATYFFLAVQYPTALDAVARRLYDVEPRIRYLAADALRGYAGEGSYTRILQSLREQLKVPVLETQVTTVQVLGQLRDPRAVPSLIPLVVSPQQPLRSAATSALAVICAQAFEQDVTHWAQWWRANYAKPREAWLVSSLRHENINLQRIAFTELQLMTGYSGTFDPNASPEDKEPVVRVWENWLRELERSRSGGQGTQQPSA